ncbi:hypothetical protein LCY76_15815 [Fictibacillus sp. KIGAM418]|uniref:Uncharacterized protein n=1 Tax=Fictibacillus marinisediminis TaxID=2878389 RepID=A0A9X1XFF3_9BACL|nr:hypothetical protein [Fictibacillus marinisediminis]MCK6258045.1 hypothetical protein [Fictibacillus marinisediminis]
MASNRTLKALCLLALLVYGIPHLHFSKSGSPSFVFSVIWLTFACIAFIAQTKGFWMALGELSEDPKQRKSEYNEDSRETCLKNH